MVTILDHEHFSPVNQTLGPMKGIHNLYMNSVKRNSIACFLSSRANMTLSVMAVEFALCLTTCLDTCSWADWAGVKQN